MLLVEREKEISALTGLLDEALSGSGGVAVVTGPVASGKTALLLELAERTVSAGGTFLSATGSRAERALPLGLVSQLLYDADMPAEGLNEVQSALDGTLAAIPYDQQSLGEGELENLGVRPATLHRLSKIFFDLAADGPLVVGVDDAHYADAASLLVLLHLAQRLRTAPILLVVTQCSAPHARRRLFQTELLHQHGCESVHLRTLTEDGVRAVLAQRLGNQNGQFLAADFHRASGGNPLLVKALADDYRADGGTVIGGVPVGEALGRAVATCLFRCEATMRDALHALAVLGCDSDTRMVADMLDLSAEATADVIGTLEETGLLLEGHFRHEGVRAMVLRGMPPEQHSALHARAAAALRNRHVNAGRIARHLVAAGRSEEAWALETLRQAADEALRDDDVALAVDCLRTALEACTDPRLRAEIRSVLLRAEWRMDPAAAARHLPELCEAARENWLECRDLTGLVSQLMWQGRLEQAAKVLDTLRSNMAKHGAAPKPDTLIIGLMVSQAFPELSERLLPSWLRPGPFDPEIGNGSVHLRAAEALRGVFSGNFGQDTVEAAEGVLQSSRLDDNTLSGIAVALIALIFADHGERALYWCRQLSEDAAGRSAPMWTALFSALRSLAHLRRGELHAAEKYAGDALIVIPLQGWGAAAGLPLSVAVMALTALGRVEEAGALLSVPVPNVVFRTPSGLLYLQARGRHHLAAGRVQAALSDFLRCGEMMKDWGLDAPNMVAWRVEAAAATLRLGRDQEACRLLEEQLALATWQDRRTRGRALALLAVTVGDPTERVRLLAESLDNLQFSGDWYEQLRAATDLAHAYEQMGDEAAARAEQGRLRLLAELCGLTESEAIERPQHARTPVAAVPDAAGNRAIHAVRTSPQPESGAQPPLSGPTAATDLSTSKGNTATAASGTRVPTPLASPPRAPQTGSVKQLTQAERRVVALAADGHTNRQIASNLFITVSTVEQHLTRAYRKLRVNRRSDLPVSLLSDVAS
jgi:DNA-binding CsgD family transcriptional regulator/tetratricopeptide (TPR) repeat protein